MRNFLPLTSATVDATATSKRQRLGIYLLVLAGVIFRAEVALLLFTELGYLLLSRQITPRTTITAGVKSAIVALAISVPIDSYFWQKPLWPELSAFYYNAILGSSSAWGTSPWHTYFTSSLPRLLLNPLIPIFLLPLALTHPLLRRASWALAVPALSFVAIYSLQPHKEARFIIYAVPPLTACAARACTYIYNRRAKSLLYRLTTFVLLLSVPSTFVVQTAFLIPSAANYPGGHALARLHDIASHDKPRRHISVHLDVLSCMTGVTRFVQLPPPPAGPVAFDPQLPRGGLAPHWHYDKTEDEDQLLDPMFWERFDYVLAERPEKAIGAWEVVDTVKGYGGMRIVRPAEARTAGGGKGLDALWHRSGEWMRQHVTRGWWLSVRMDDKIRILRRAKGGVIVDV